MIGGVNFASSQIASVYNDGSQQLAATLTKIASGKKFQNASEDLLGFVRAQGLDVDIGGYERVREGLTEFKTYSAAAVQASSAIYENLTEMKDIAAQYAGTSDTDLQAQYKSEFDALAQEVVTALENTYVDGDLVTGSGSEIKAVDLDPDGTGSLSMNFTGIASNTDVAGLNIADTTNAQDDVQNEVNSMLTYMSEAKAYDNIADQQLKLTNTIISSKQAVKSLITDIDEAEEAPWVFARLRGAIDADRKRNGRFLLLGSVSPSLMKNISESLAGRMGLVQMGPLNLSKVVFIAKH